MKIFKFTLITATLTALLGCSNNIQEEQIMANETATNGELLPAYIEASTENTDRLKQALSKSLNGISVNIPTDAFTKSSTLSTERIAQDKIGQEGMNGRMMGMPNDSFNFALYRKGDSCYLVNKTTGKKILVAGLVCKPM